MNNIKNLESNQKSITITFNLTYACNFSCYYCVAWERNYKTFIFNEVSKKEIKFLIDSIKTINPNINIDFILSWWEPLKNKYFLNIVDYLLWFEKLTVMVTTNWFLIWNIKNNISVLKNKRFSFFYTYHYYEYKKFDKNLKIVVNNINLLKLKNISFKLNFLIPSNFDDFDDFKNKKDFIISETNLNDDEYILNLIQEWWIISNKYPLRILDYNNNNNNKMTSIENNDLMLTSLDNSKINIIYTKEIIEKWYNNFKWYLCYPFSIPTNILLNHDLSVVFAWCDTMSDKVYSIEKAINHMKKPNTKIICNTDYCRCWSNIIIKKEYNNTINTKINKLNDSIMNKIIPFMIIEGVEFCRF